MVSEVVLLRRFGLPFLALVEIVQAEPNVLVFGARFSKEMDEHSKKIHALSGRFDLVEDELMLSFWSQQHDWVFWSERSGWISDREAHYHFTGLGPWRRFHAGNVSFCVPRRLSDWVNTFCGFGIKERQFSLPTALVEDRGMKSKRLETSLSPEDWIAYARSEQQPFVEDIKSQNVVRFFDTSSAGRAEVRKYLQFDGAMMRRLIRDGAQILW